MTCPSHREGSELSDEPTAFGAGDAHVEPAGAGAPITMRSALPILDDAARSSDPAVCPFFRLEQADGALLAPLHRPDDANRCAAIGAPRPQSARQQELVCLKAAHADCPRYLRGALALHEPGPARRASPMPRATLAALLILVLSAGISFGFVVQRGGIDLPVAGAGATPSASAVALVETPSSEAMAVPSPIEPTPSASPTVEPSPSPSPTLEPTPSPTVPPTARPVPTATPTSARYKLLTPCPDEPNCYIYVVRSGDNLYSIAKFFGIPLKTIYEWNPTYANGAGLRAGDKIRMPPPPR